MPETTPKKFHFTCPKCQNNKYELSELRGSSDGLSAYFDIDTSILTLVICAQCRYCETYHMRSKEFRKLYGLH